MAKTTKRAVETDEQLEPAAAEVPKTRFARFEFWLVGDTPLICHAWSQKAKGEMLKKQKKQTSDGREIRNPEQDFRDSLYEMEPGAFGFPAMAAKKALLSVAHKDIGIPRETLRKALLMDADMTQTRPALMGAICDMPLLRLYGTEPEMREDMVRVGAGLRKTASLAYRAQFTVWALRITGRLNVGLCPVGWIPFVAKHSGLSTGLGDWRVEKNGMFGSFHLGSPKEAADWERFREWRHANPKLKAEKGPLPVVVPFGGDPELTGEAA